MRKSFLARRARALSATLLGIALGALPVAGCFKAAPDTSQLKCTTQAGCPADYYCASDQKCHLGAADGGAGSGAGGAGGAALDGPGNTGGARDGALTYGGSDGSSALTEGGPSSQGGGGVGQGSLGSGGVAGGPVNGGASGGALPGSGGSPGDASHGTGGMAPDAPLSAGGAGSPDALITPDASTTLAIGATCTSPSQCTSGYCVDGVCCSEPCSGQCQSCSQAGSPGQCVAIKGSPIAPRAACAGKGTCQGQCNGSGQECTFDNTTVCAPQSCSQGVRTNKSICDGKGDCPVQTTTACTDNQCTTDGTDCSTCTDNSSATTCSGGHCGPTVDNCGNTVSCGTCATGTCVSGTCCVPNCTGKCGGAGDTCGGTCTGTCGAGKTCVNESCVCAPNCTNKCGGASDGCGGTCTGTCGSGQNCYQQQCCTPVGQSQTCGTATCGKVTDNCGNQVTCGTGTCPSGQSCVNNQCACSLGSYLCSTCLGWGFQSGVGSWEVNTTIPNAILGSLAQAALHPPDATNSLTFFASTDPNGPNAATIMTPLCSGGGAVSLNGLTLSLEIYVDATLDGSTIMWLGEYQGGEQTGGSLGDGSTLTAGTWYSFTATGPVSDAPPLDTVWLIIGTSSSSSWSGDVYLADIQFK